jgi:acetoin:2,6-dichlorophenolindophenol oxidoreductase subunit beta
MRTMNFTQAIIEALREEMQRDEKVVIWGEDVGQAGGAFAATKGLIEEFGEDRVRDTPIAENIIIGMAVGAAITGLRPVPEIMFADFLACAMDQIANQLAKIRYMSGGQVKVPVTIRTCNGAGLRAAAQHSQSLHPWFVNLPGIKVVAPSTPADAMGLLKSSIRDDNPVIFFEHKELYNIKGDVPEGDHLIPLGRADIKRQGTDVTIVAVQYMVHKALEAAEELAKRGISVEVIDPRTLMPLDRTMIINSVRKTQKLVVVDECNLSAGMQSEILSAAVQGAFDYLEAPPKLLGVPNVPIPFSPPMEDYVLPNAENIIAAVEDVLA